MTFLVFVTIIWPASAAGPAVLNRAGLAAVIQNYFDARFPAKLGGPARFESTDHVAKGDIRIWAHAQAPSNAALTIGYARIGQGLICRVDYGLADENGRIREAVFTTCVQLQRSDVGDDLDPADLFARNLSLTEATYVNVDSVRRKVLKPYRGREIFRFTLNLNEMPVHRRARLFFRHAPDARQFATEPLGAVLTGTAVLDVRRRAGAPAERVSREIQIPLWTCARSLVVRPAFRVKLGPEIWSNERIGF